MIFRSKALLTGAMGLMALSLAPPASAQYRDRDGEFRRVEPGTVIPVRLNETIDVERKDNRVYYGIVEQDIRTDRGRLAVPRGSSVELVVHVAPDNDLTLDMESITVNGERYGLRAAPNRVESRHDAVGDIVGALNGGVARGRAVRIPRDSVVTFRLTRPLDMGVPDRGYDRDGRHYHDWDREYR